MYHTFPPAASFLTDPNWQLFLPTPNLTPFPFEPRMNGCWGRDKRMGVWNPLATFFANAEPDPVSFRAANEWMLGP